MFDNLKELIEKQNKASDLIKAQVLLLEQKANKEKFCSDVAVAIQYAGASIRFKQWQKDVRLMCISEDGQQKPLVECSRKTIIMGGLAIPQLLTTICEDFRHIQNQLVFVSELIGVVEKWYPKAEREADAISATSHL